MAVVILVTVSLTLAFPGKVKLEGIFLRAARVGKHLPKAEWDPRHILVLSDMYLIIHERIHNYTTLPGSLGI